MENRDSQVTRIFTLPEPFKGPLQKKAFSLVQRGIEKTLFLEELNSIYRSITEKEDAKQFIDQVLTALNIDYTITGIETRSIPREGPLVVVANHLFGGLEGLILGSLLLRVRPDTKIMANYLLARIPQLRTIMFPVDPFERKESAFKNLKPLRDSLVWLKAGHALVVFPAGAVSSLSLQEHRVIDPKWHDSVARIVRKSGAPVLPVFFAGANSALFQLAALLHTNLKTALFPRELLNKRNKKIIVRIGSPVPFKKLNTFTSDEKLMAYLRMRTYTLKYRNQEKPAKKGDILFFKRRSNIEPLTLLPSPGPDVVAEEVDQLPPEQKLLKSGEFTVFHAQAHQMPNLLAEIGRLREITFRTAGEGTGKPCDLDRFDLHYTHLVVWNAAKKHVVGAYRLGRIDSILNRFGKHGLYTSTLFEYNDNLLQHIGNGIELGRSFVRNEYQRLYAPLLLLWKGIARFVAFNPYYTTLFGPVSISNNYSALSRQFMVCYLSANHYAHDMARLIKPRTPVRDRPLKKLNPKFAAVLPCDIDELSSLISDIEADRKGIPVLLKQYVKLGGKLMGFNIDGSFGNALDGLVIVDLLKCDRKILDRYMGDDGSARFFEYHQQPPLQGLAS